MRKIDIKDLMQSSPFVRDNTNVEAMIRDKRVLITGAGGSIGSELARQILNLNPQKLVLLDNSEFNLYTITQNIPASKGYLADVRDLGRLRSIFKDEQPQIVFHAAVLKHVPIVEDNQIEGYKTNVSGTNNVVYVCSMNFVSTMVFISTDKAVNPTNFMGRYKRAAEELCLAEHRTVVRFGNVLGSSGSVVPLFERQIAAGGPVTITDPDIERYFMSIDEAVELVLHAATLPPGLYVLDMGHPVKIIDLARDMIRLAGYMPETEIPIEIVGLRPGEKIREDLFYSHENQFETALPGIIRAV